MKPPTLPVWLLNRFVDENEPLVGDLVEEFDARQSRLWFWRQVIVAILLRVRNRDREIRPLRLIDGRSAIRSVQPEAARRNLPQPINLTGSPIHGVGGLGLVAFGVLVAAFAPETWWLVLAVVLGGGLVGGVMVAISRRRMLRRN